MSGSPRGEAPRIKLSGRLGAQHADLDEEPGEVEDTPLVHDAAVLQAVDEAARDLDAPAGRRHGEELSRVAAGDTAEERGPVLVDEQIFGGEDQVRERGEPDAVDALDFRQPLEHAARR